MLRGVSALRLPSPAQAGDPEALAALTGSIQALEVSKLDTVGLTGARHERLGLTLRSGERCSLVVKRVRLSVDWIACRTSDRRGREAAMLEEPALGAMWDAFICPYRAYAMGRDEIALVAGARMLLWSKALAVDAGRPGAQAEWSWWAERLDAAGS